MSKLCWFLLSSWLLLGISVGTEPTTKGKPVYYKQSIPTAAVAAGAVAEPQSGSKENVRITMEGQMQNITSKVLRKKTVPRKGAIPDESIEIHPDLVKTNSSVVVTKPNKQIVVNPVEILSTAKPINQRVAPVKEEPQEKPVVVVALSSTTRKPKPKPILTIGGKEADGPIPASPTDKSPISMPRKIDYIVPVIITFTALPLLGVTFYILYKRGKDYWSKRHYRRMDFLIDGMYNE